MKVHGASNQRKSVQSNLAKGRIADLCYPSQTRMDSSDLNPHLTQGSLDPHESAPKRHLDQFTRFFRVYERDQQTQ